MRPLFIPLKAEHYVRFEDGSKRTEYRAYGPRWNEKTCPPGREVLLSYGYGKGRRMTGVVEYAEVEYPTADFLRIYGADKKCFAIHLTNLKKVNHAN